jgi:hypothetical protein
MHEEMDALVRNGTWRRVKRDKAMRVLPGKWVLKIKSDGRFKARWVVGGHRQREGIDYTDVYASVVKSMSIRVLLALTAIHDLEAHQLDVLNAFLNADLKETIYMELPHGYEEDGYVALLLKTLYGLRQSPREWYQSVYNLLVKIGFRACESDRSVFVNNAGVVIIVYVDDIILFGKDKQTVASAKTQLTNTYRMKDFGDLTTYLGMEIHRDRATGIVELHQEAYTAKLLTEFGYSDMKEEPTPMDTRVIWLPNQEPSDQAVTANYQKMIGGLLFLTTHTRIDLAVAISKLAQFCANPGQDHVSAVKRVFRYLNKAMKLGIRWQKSGNNRILGYTDANWAGGTQVDNDGRRSRSGYVFTLADGAVSWSSRRQHTIATSSCEAEYIGQCNAGKEAMWLRTIMNELGYPQIGPTVIYADNQSAIALASNPVYHARSRHIDIQYHYVRMLVARAYIDFIYVPTAEMTADGLTKPLDKVKFARFVAQLGLVESTRSSVGTARKA